MPTDMIPRPADHSARDPDVTFFLPNLRGGGAQQVFCNLARGFADEGYAVDLLVTWATGELRQKTPAGVHVIELDPRRLPVIGSAAGIPAMVSYLEAASPAVLYSAMTYANVSAVVAARMADGEVAVIPTEHTMISRHQTTTKDWLVNRFAGIVYSDADAVVAVSESVANEVAETIGINRDQLTVVHNPIITSDLQARAAEPVEEAWVPDDAPHIVLSVGRLAVEKDFETLVRAFAALVTDHDRDAALVVFGEGPERGRLRRVADSLGVGNRVSFPGYVDNPYKYMRLASIFVSSSRFEGLPTTLVEAMACGCPVVATDCPGGSAEVLCGGQYGSLVPVGEPDILASRIEATLSSPPDPDTLCERAADFTVDAAVDEYLRLGKNADRTDSIDSVFT
jgi:glycosyltransferase involved in cell wall biosynthesis